MSLEWWKSFFEIGGVILLFLTFTFGSGVAFISNKLSDRQAAQPRDFDSELTTAKIELGKQQERAAKAGANCYWAQTESALNL